MAPAVLVAARQKFLASSQYAVLVAQGVTDAPFVTVDTNPLTGLPAKYGPGMVSVTVYERANSWHTNDTSARFPKLGVTIWTTGDRSTRDAEWLARSVAESVLAVFDDPAGEHPPTWGPDVFVIRCRWDGELSVSEVENVPGMYRADVGLNLEVA